MDVGIVMVRDSIRNQAQSLADEVDR